MPRDYNSLDLKHVRRKDRAVDDDSWISDYLHQASWGIFSMTFRDQPVANSNIFVYVPEENAIYWHTAGEGRTRSTLEQNDKVCLTVSSMGRLLPAKTALEMSVEYAGVAVFGKAHIVEEETAAVKGLEKLLFKYFPHLKAGEHYRAITENERKRTTIFKLEIDTWVGKKKEVEDDFSGAFTYPYFPDKE